MSKSCQGSCISDHALILTQFENCGKQDLLNLHAVLMKLKAVFHAIIFGCLHLFSPYYKPRKSILKTCGAHVLIKL